ncbi:Bifunctional NMN adenylyltransferase/Nudix hydrolase [Frondihabitans sp. 762G35]|uniref:NUDIX hydrolase n=1 Tax=Frondihabitans sp. 762G35 TaxID=1446794 RepID=UPI000D222F70|nr:NUDIX domain-containing protein [Frondihabitans sp. 762G35]ARC57774.1 Bifunctional NMN adenylyltransferase/Nudix hydrolase [Frondihabitans sp. 762G35]
MAPPDRAPDETASPALAVSTVIFSLMPSDTTGRTALHIPLVRRIREPYLGLWALPGGPLGLDEDLSDAARRHLFATTALSPTYLEQLYAFGARGRSLAERVVSIVYWALVARPTAGAASPAAGLVTGDPNVCWFDADHLPALAFDHAAIVEYALWRLRTKMEYSRIAHAFIGETFTLTQLREVYEAVLSRELDPANFRRTVEASDAVVPTGEFLTGTPHRPPRLYRYDTRRDLADPSPLASETFLALPTSTSAERLA